MTASESMKVVVFERYGSPDVLSLQTVPRPFPSRGEVRVKVHASTVNRTDTASRLDGIANPLVATVVGQRGS